MDLDDPKQQNKMIHVIDIFYCNDSSCVLKCSIRNKFCILVVVSNICFISPQNWEDSHFEYFSDGLKPPTRLYLVKL